MKTFKKQFIAGIGRALGMLVVYATVVGLLYACGITGKTPKFGGVTGEIVASITE